MSEDTDKNQFTIHTSRLFDSRAKTFRDDISIKIDRQTGLITKVYQRESEVDQISPQDLDLRGKTVLPGFVDAHTHIFLHGYSETPSINQERDEGLIERTIRATNHCRAALKAGFTTYRDLGTEGAHDADVGVRDAVNRGLIPGPRLFVATEPLASSGGYAIRQENHLGGTTVPRLADPCDGVDGVKAGVRRRLGAGADVIKFYADYRKRALRFPAQAWPGAPPVQFPPMGGMIGQRNPNCLLFDQAEMNEIVREARASRAPVAAHAQSAVGVVMAANAGVTSVEHGPFLDGEGLKAMKQNGTIFVPTLAVLEVFKSELGKKGWDEVLMNAKRAFDTGIKMAAGGDTGAFAHGENAREMELLIEAGIPMTDVLRMGTLAGWEACGGDWCGRRFGSIEQGWAADLVALDGDLEQDISALRRVVTVVKDGRVVSKDGTLLES